MSGRVRTIREGESMFVMSCEGGGTDSARGGGVAIGGQSLMCSIEDGIAHFVTRREIG